MATQPLAAVKQKKNITAYRVLTVTPSLVHYGDRIAQDGPVKIESFLFSKCNKFSEIRTTTCLGQQQDKKS